MARENTEITKSTVTPVGVAQYPSLTTPDTRFDERGTFKTNLILSEEAAQPMMDMVDAMIEKRKESLAEEMTPAKFKKATQSVRTPFEFEENDNGEETGNVIFKCKTTASFVSKRDGSVIDKKVPIVDAKKTTVSGITIGGGSKIKVAVELRTYYVPSIGLGVSARLQAVQLIELAEFAGGGKATSMFGEEDGYEATPESTVSESFDSNSDDDEVDL